MIKTVLPIALAATLAAVMAPPAAASDRDAVYAFHWQGAGGYSVRGALAVDEALVGSVIYETDVSCFVIRGEKDGEPIGAWKLGQLVPETTWRLHFDTAAEAFVVDGDGIRMPQAWNMNGRGDNCGEDGFGFNLGNVGQDICVDNKIIDASRVPPPTPFPATRVESYSFPQGACRMPVLLGGHGPVPGARG
jgi:hypothetical protein